MRFVFFFLISGEYISVFSKLLSSSLIFIFFWHLCLLVCCCCCFLKQDIPSELSGILHTVTELSWNYNSMDVVWECIFVSIWMVGNRAVNLAAAHKSAGCVFMLSSSCLIHKPCKPLQIFSRSFLIEAYAEGS